MIKPMQFCWSGNEYEITLIHAESTDLLDENEGAIIRDESDGLDLKRVVVLSF